MSVTLLVQCQSVGVHRAPAFPMQAKQTARILVTLPACPPLCIYQSWESVEGRGTGTLPGPRSPHEPWLEGRRTGTLPGPCSPHAPWLAGRGTGTLPGPRSPHEPWLGSVARRVAALYGRAKTIHTLAAGARSTLCALGPLETYNSLATQQSDHKAAYRWRRTALCCA